jgi:hypothetical protein
MSGESSYYRRELPAHPESESDLFVMRFANPHTAIPDWLVVNSHIRLELRHMAAVIIILQKRPLPPDKEQIAEILGVGTRTVQRWLAELRAAGVLSYKLLGRRRMYVFHEPSTISDPTISDPTISDPALSSDTTISDPGVSHETNYVTPIHGIPYAGIDSYNRLTISDRSGGGGDHDHGGIEPPTTAPRRAAPKVSPDSIATETGRWLVKTGFNIASAYRFQTIPLKVAMADYERRRDLGQGIGAIVQAWRVELPEFDLMSDAAGAVVDSARRAELRAKYGDLFLFSGDEPEGVDQ